MTLIIAQPHIDVHTLLFRIRIVNEEGFVLVTPVKNWNTCCVQHGPKSAGLHYYKGTVQDFTARFTYKIHWSLSVTDLILKCLQEDFQTILVTLSTYTVTFVNNLNVYLFNMGQVQTEMKIILSFLFVLDAVMTSCS